MRGGTISIFRRKSPPSPRPATKPMRRKHQRWQSPHPLRPRAERREREQANNRAAIKAAEARAQKRKAPKADRSDDARPRASSTSDRARSRSDRKNEATNGTLRDIFTSPLLVVVAFVALAAIAWFAWMRKG